MLCVPDPPQMAEHLGDAALDRLADASVRSGAHIHAFVVGLVIGRLDDEHSAEATRTELSHEARADEAARIKIDVLVYAFRLSCAELAP